MQWRSRVLAIWLGLCLALGLTFWASAQTNVANPAADLAGKTLVTAEGNRTITGLFTFSRSTSPPFAVNAGSALVSNLVVDAALLAGTGTVPTARLGTGSAVVSAVLRGDNTWGAIGTATFSATGTASSVTYLRGDNAWAAVSSGCLATLQSKVAAYSAVIGDWIAGSGTFVVTLPQASTTTTTSCPITIANVGPGTITVAKTNGGTDTVVGNAGETSQTLNPGDSLSFKGDGGTAWRIF